MNLLKLVLASPITGGEVNLPAIITTLLISIAIFTGYEITLRVLNYRAKGKLPISNLRQTGLIVLSYFTWSTAFIIALFV